MKTTGIVLAGLFLLFASPAQAQWHVGGLIGINIASVNVDPEPSSEDYSSRSAFGIGAVVDRPLTNQIATATTADYPRTAAIPCQIESPPG